MSKSAHKPAVNRPCFVYRLFDIEDQLIYVGMMFNPLARGAQHTKKWWWSQVEHWRVTIYPSREHARRVEAAAIYAEQPRYNRVGKSRRPQVVAQLNSPLVKALAAFSAEYEAESGRVPSARIRRVEALRLVAQQQRSAA